MAAIYALVFVPALAAVLFMLGGQSITVGSVAAVLIFGALASGVFLGLLRMMRGWEGDEGHSM